LRRIDRSIAAETREVAVVASGEINLVDQTLRLELRPSVKKGLGLNPANLATDFMEISGPLQNLPWASPQGGRAAARPRSAWASQPAASRCWFRRCGRDEGGLGVRSGGSTCRGAACASQKSKPGE
jgi:hypothetical protein